MPPHRPLRALPTSITPNGVRNVTAGSDGQEFVNLNPPVEARNAPHVFISPTCLFATDVHNTAYLGTGSDSSSTPDPSLFSGISADDRSVASPARRTR